MASKSLRGLNPISQLYVEGMSGGRGIFKDRTDQGQGMHATSLDGCRMEGPVDEANGLTGLFANMINIEIPREFVSKNDAKKFCRRHTLNRLIVESKSNIWKRISLCRDDHELCFGEFGSEMIQTKLIMNRINVRLKVN